MLLFVMKTDTNKIVVDLLVYIYLSYIYCL